jgi:hypothetical protein
MRGSAKTPKRRNSRSLCTPSAADATPLRLCEGSARPSSAKWWAIPSFPSRLSLPSRLLTWSEPGRVAPDYFSRSYHLNRLQHIAVMLTASLQRGLRGWRPRVRGRRGTSSRIVVVLRVAQQRFDAIPCM